MRLTLGTMKASLPYQYYLLMDDGRYIVYRFRSADYDAWGSRLVRVWREGPKGGVKIVHNRSVDGYHYGYITNNPAAMKEFMWAKLSAQELKYAT